MGQKLLPLKPNEVCSNLKKLGFVLKRQVGSHAHYERAADGKRIRSVVTVDMSMKKGFSRDIMKSMIRQSNFTATEFCSGTIEVIVVAEKESEPHKE